MNIKELATFSLGVSNYKALESEIISAWIDANKAGLPAQDVTELVEALESIVANGAMRSTHRANRARLRDAYAVHKEGSRKDGCEMTQVLIDRATLEQLVVALEKSVGAMQGLYGGWRCEQPLKLANASITQGRAALANAEPTGWKPIETAPATANKVLAFSESGNMKIETGHWLRNMLYAAKVDGEHCNYTHWMPLPTPPKDAL